VSYGDKLRERRRAESAPQAQDEYVAGTVKFIHDKGYGFIACEGHQQDVYFHLDRLDPDIRRSIRKEDEVLVAVSEGRKGPVAAAVKYPEE